MANSNKRIVKKLSRKAAEFMPKVNWDCDDSEPYCEWWDYLLKGTPILWFRCSYEYDEYESRCAWSVLKMIFMNARDSATHIDNGKWHWGRKPTPANVFWWAYWNPSELDSITERNFGY